MSKVFITLFSILMLTQFNSCSLLDTEQPGVLVPPTAAQDPNYLLITV